MAKRFPHRFGSVSSCLSCLNFFNHFCVPSNHYFFCCFLNIDFFVIESHLQLSLVGGPVNGIALDQCAFITQGYLLFDRCLHQALVNADTAFLNHLLANLNVFLGRLERVAVAHSGH